MTNFSSRILQASLLEGSRRSNRVQASNGDVREVLFAAGKWSLTVSPNGFGGAYFMLHRLDRTAPSINIHPRHPDGALAIVEPGRGKGYETHDISTGNLAYMARDIIKGKQPTSGMIEALIKSAKQGRLDVPSGEAISGLILPDGWEVRDQGRGVIGLHNSHSIVSAEYDPRSKSIYVEGGDEGTVTLTKLSAADLLKEVNAIPARKSLNKAAAVAFIASAKNGKAVAK